MEAYGSQTTTFGSRFNWWMWRPATSIGPSDSIARCLCVSAEQFQEARLVKITHWGVATWLNPLGMLEPQVVVNLFAELGTSTNLVRRDRRVVEIFDYVVRCAHVLKIGRRAHGSNSRGFLA